MKRWQKIINYLFLDDRIYLSSGNLKCLLQLSTNWTCNELIEINWYSFVDKSIIYKTVWIRFLAERQLCMLFFSALSDLQIYSIYNLGDVMMVFLISKPTLIRWKGTLENSNGNDDYDVWKKTHPDCAVAEVNPWKEHLLLHTTTILKHANI